MSAEARPAEDAAETRAPRTCPRCGQEMRPAQDWCLNCGAAVTTHIASAPTWRGPLIAMIGVLVLALAALVLAFFALADDDPPSDPTAATTPTPAPPAPTTAPPASPTPTPTPEPTSQPEELAEWPVGEAAWTIVLSSTTSRAAAERRAQRFTEAGIPDVGILRSDDFASLRRGFWVVFSGQHDSSRAAARAQRDLTSAPASAYVRQITPR